MEADGKDYRTSMNKVRVLAALWFLSLTDYVRLLRATAIGVC